MSDIHCILCRRNLVDVSLLFCVPCRNAASDSESLRQIARDLQQFSMVLSARFSDTNRFFKAIQAGALAAGFRDVVGPAAVKVIGQRSTYTGGVIGGWRLVERALQGRGIGEKTDVKSISVTLIEGGNLLTVIELRGMLDEELAGSGGVGR